MLPMRTQHRREGASAGGAEGRTREFEDLSTENPPTDMQREKRMQNPPEIAENCGTVTKAIQAHGRVTRRRKEEIREATTAENFSELMTLNHTSRKPRKH